MKNIIEKLKQVDKGTIIRTAALVVSILNNIAAVIATACGANTIAYLVIASIATVVSALIAGWENNDWTEAARLGTGVLDALQDGKITKDEVEALLNGEQKTEKTRTAAGGGKPNNKTTAVK